MRCYFQLKIVQNESFTHFYWHGVTDVRAIGLKSFMQDITGFIGTGMIHDFFQIAGIDRLYKANIIENTEHVR